MKNQKFLCLCIFDETIESLLIINASTKEEAHEKFVGHYAPKDNLYKQYVYEKAINAGLFCHFFGDEKGHFMDDFTGEIAANNEYIWECVKQNVSAFFGEHADYAQMYLRYVKDEDIKFPDDMLIYIAHKDGVYETVQIISLLEIEEIS